LDKISRIDWVTRTVRQKRERSRRRGAPSASDHDRVKKLCAKIAAQRKNRITRMRTVMGLTRPS
jgi:hypothetical protein